MTGPEWIFCGLCVALVIVQLFLLLLLFLFVCRRARLVVKEREQETEMDPEERQDPAVNIIDNPAFSFDEYDVIPGQYLNNNNLTSGAKYLFPKRGSLGKILEIKIFPDKIKRI